MAFFPLQVLHKSVVKDGQQVVAKIVVGKLSVQVLAGAQQDDVQRLMCALLAVQP